ncbi:AMIN domain-containing protein [Candidatus Reidiella endopervernicosa]|uniref:AMIN domain-containing protein n=1 Tax=Candidatus Reidiella endopervernicosa TaxID=2738883 RepID=A0A6N0HTE7_9GAMM|nr:AMIN domain-containing protein [Candidatus Reidiella endopervernicosa]QKQ25688.1 AMIN domain-containing protein [Candidatus Reidiella endopervernicosa]
MTANQATNNPSMTVNQMTKKNLRTSLGHITSAIVAFLLLISSSVTASAQNTLTGIDYSALSGDRIQLTLTLSEAATTPRSFTTNHPARIALDFSGVSNATNKNSLDVAIGTVQSIRIAEAQGRTRIVLNLTELTPYETNVIDNRVILTIASDTSSQATQTTQTTPAQIATLRPLKRERRNRER